MTDVRIGQVVKLSVKAIGKLIGEGRVVGVERMPDESLLAILIETTMGIQRFPLRREPDDYTIEKSLAH
ncbi:MAG: hypothetical protein ACYDHY_06445 [Acidiferrobacterales bacterium]